MRYALISDIHANLPALSVVLDDIKAKGCDQILCLGDIVGYGEQPRECVQKIRELGIPCIRGNFEEYCLDASKLEGCNPEARKGIEWTLTQLSPQNLEWFGSLPYSLNFDEGFTIVHATLDAPERWQYAFDKVAAASNFGAQKQPLCFYGHTHVPVAFVKDSVVRGGTFDKFKVDPNKKYFVNVGSVGQPRDGTLKASYCVYDSGTREIELRRLNLPKPA